MNWRPPRRDGRQPIIRYHVEIRGKNEHKFTRCTDDFISECEYEVKGLIENHEYEFRIVAENKHGESEPSEPRHAFKARDLVPGTRLSVKLQTVLVLLGIMVRLKCMLLVHQYRILYGKRVLVC